MEHLRSPGSSVPLWGAPTSVVLPCVLPTLSFPQTRLLWGRSCLWGSDPALSGEDTGHWLGSPAGPPQAPRRLPPTAAPPIAFWSAVSAPLSLPILLTCFRPFSLGLAKGGLMLIFVSILIYFVCFRCSVYSSLLSPIPGLMGAAHTVADPAQAWSSEPPWTPPPQRPPELRGREGPPPAGRRLCGHSPPSPGSRRKPAWGRQEEKNAAAGTEQEREGDPQGQPAGVLQLCPRAASTPAPAAQATRLLRPSVPPSLLPLPLSLPFLELYLIQIIHLYTLVCLASFHPCQVLKIHPCWYFIYYQTYIYLSIYFIFHVSIFI